MIITLSQKHIDEGVKQDCHHCPAALAIAEATGEEFVEVATAIRWGEDPTGSGGWKWKHRVSTPPILREFMDRYDSGLLVEPITFELEQEKT